MPWNLFWQEDAYLQQHSLYIYIYICYLPCMYSVRSNVLPLVLIYFFFFNFRLLWPSIMNVGWRERNQQDATNLMFINKLYLNMFRASLCPSSGEQECALPHMVFCTGCDGCGCVELGCKLCASIPAPHSHSHHYQCRTPYAAVHTLVLLMMGIMMPETCWDKVC